MLEDPAGAELDPLGPYDELGVQSVLYLHDKSAEPSSPYSKINRQSIIRK